MQVQYVYHCCLCLIFDQITMAQEQKYLRNPEYFAGSTSNMADAWREDLKLREDMERYVRQGYKRDQALDFLKRDFPMYPWSIRSLDRRLRCFEIYYNNPEVSVEEVKDAVKKELEGPGRLLGYRAMHQKVRQETISRHS